MRHLLFLILFSLTALIEIRAEYNLDNEGLPDVRPISMFERLSSSDVVHLTIKTDLNQLIAEKKAKKYQRAFLQLPGEDKSLQEWSVDIKARGKFRNMMCDFPPVKIKFDHSTLGPENLKAYKTLKLVTHCGDQESLAGLVQKEYLAYKLYNLITEESFEVQMVKVTWEDTEGSMEVGEQWGFIIEHEDELADRLGGAIYDQFGVSDDDLNYDNLIRHGLFQRMIGNEDWNLEMNKNVKLVKDHTSKDITVVPYDFDFSSIVKAPYATKPKEEKEVVQRFMNEDLINSTSFAKAKELFLSKKEDMLQLVKSTKHLARHEKSRMKKHIEAFFIDLEGGFESAPNEIRIASKATSKSTTSTFGK